MPISLHRVRFDFGNGTRLDIERVKGRGGGPSPVPIPFAAVTEVELDPDDDAFVPAICWRSHAPVLFEPFQLRENTDYYIDITLPVSVSQAADHIAAEAGWPFGSGLARIFTPDPPRRWKSNADGTLTISGQLRLRNHAGILNLGLGEAAPLAAEVVCSKLHYMEEFKALLDEVAAELTDLLLHYDSPVGASFNLSDLSPETEAALLFQIRHIMSGPNLPTALEEIHRAFHSRLEDRRAAQDAFDVEDFDLPAFVEEMDIGSLAAGGPLQRIFRGYTPRTVPAIFTTETANTPENRFVKFFLEELRQASQRLAASYAGRERTSSFREIEGWIATLDEELSGGLWKSVGPFSAFPSNSQVLQKRRGYREIMRFDLSLRMSLELPWKRSEQFAEGLIGDIRPVNELYEYWCFFLLRRSLFELCLAETPRGRSFIDTSNGGLQVHLRRGNRSRAGFVYRRQRERVLYVNLYYNRRFVRPTRPLDFWHGSYTATFHPDYSLEAVLVTGAQTARHWLHFDAKYRIERADISHLAALDTASIDGEPSPSGDYQAELARLHRQDDLFKMHTYRDGILSSRGAYILFPGDADDSSIFVRHPSASGGAPDYLFPSVGAFSLCPGRSDGQRPVLRTFIGNVLEAIFRGEPYQEETGLF